MLIAAVVGICILLLILGFLVPRLSRHPERAAHKAYGAGGRTAGKAPGPIGRWLAKPFSKSSKWTAQERRPAAGPGQGAALGPSQSFADWRSSAPVVCSRILRQARVRLLLGREVLDDLAHARRRDLDAVALADLAEAAA